MLTATLPMDLVQGALALAEAATKAANVRKYIRFYNNSCAEWVPKHTPNMVVANPPWGVRLLAADDDRRFNSSSSRGRQQQPRQGHSVGYRQQEVEEEEQGELRDTWQQLSTFLKQQCPGGQASCRTRRENPPSNSYLAIALPVLTASVISNCFRTPLLYELSLFLYVLRVAVRAVRATRIVPYVSFLDSSLEDPVH